MGVFEHFSIGKRNLQCKDNWEALDINSFRITKPTVLCLGGNGSLTTKSANAMCKVAQGLVGIKQPITQNEFATSSDVDFVGISYGRFGEKDFGSSFLTHKERNEIIDNLFMPLCLNTDGKPLPKEEIIKNFNKITFFSHCHGSAETSMLVSRTLNKMLNMGIDMVTTNAALGQMFSVSYAPWEECGIPSLQVVPMKDEVLVGGPDYSDIAHRFLIDRYFGDRNLGEGTVAYKENSLTINVLVSSMTNLVQDEHAINTTSRDENWRYERADSIYGDEVSKVLGNALANSIANSIQNQYSDTFTPKASLDEVLEETKSILGETQNSNFEYSIQNIKRDFGYTESETSVITDNRLIGLSQETSQTQPLTDDIVPEP